MERALESVASAFTNRVEKSLLTLLLIALSVFTMLKYQMIVVNTLNVFLNILVDHDQTRNHEMMITFALNLASAIGLAGMSIFWFKDVGYAGYYYEDGVSKLTCLVTGLALAVYSITFFHYLFSDLITVVIVVGIFALGIFNNKK